MRLKYSHQVRGILKTPGRCCEPVLWAAAMAALMGSNNSQPNVELEVRRK
jgi:hypothetical protein